MHDRYDSMDLEELAWSARSGDKAALDALIRRIQPDVMRRCRKRLPCPPDAEEACNDALFAVSRSIHTFQGRSKFTTWLHPIVEHSILQTYRSLCRRSQERPEWSALNQRPVVSDARTSVLAGARIEILEAMEYVRQYNPDLLEPLLLRDLAELTYDEVAERLRLPSTTAKARVMTGRKIVQSFLMRYRAAYA